MNEKTHLFKTEVSEMLDLVINSLYSKKEIFLRELVSNASDAIDRAKYRGLVEKELVADNPTWRIDVTADRDAKTLMISDNGAGMNADDLEKNLGVIASSGTKAFREALKKDGAAGAPELIGQFGVGFYSAFMVADRVRVVSRKRGETAAWRWESAGSGTYTVAEDSRDEPGTSIMLHLRDDQLEYLDEWRIRELVKAYSDFIAYPIFFKALPGKDKKEDDAKKEEPKPLNTMTALWKRPKKDIKKEEYVEFYRHLTHDWKEPLETIHFSGEGAVEFKAMLFIPSEAGMELYMPSSKRGLSLYVRNVFIGDDFDMLLPGYLRFVKGVVDSSDLPRNVSREMLQDDAVIRKIKEAVTSKILSTLEELMKKRAEAGAEAGYNAFWNVFGRVLKEGVPSDFANAERIKKLLLFPTAKKVDGSLVSLAEYVATAGESQKKIYYITAERLEDARHAPQIEAALEHGADVLLFADPVDEWLVESLREFDGRALVNLASGEVEFGTEEERKAGKESLDRAAAGFKDLFDAIRKRLASSVADVKASTRLTDSVCCLVADPNAPTPSMARMMRAMHQSVPEYKRTLEINVAHPLVGKIAGLSGAELDDAIDLLHDQALIAEGSPIPDARRFTALMTALMLK